MMPKDNDSVPSRAATAPSQSVAEFLAKARALGDAAPSSDRGRLIFAMDATLSRQPTWDLACGLQGGLFHEAERAGGLDVQLVYFRGLAECKASRWVSDSARLGELMARIACRGGNTQIGRVLDHAVAETGRRPVRALVYVGDAMEESIDDVCAKAGKLALLAVPVFLFQEGRDMVAEAAFREIARISRGAWFPFDRAAADELGALLRAVAAYAAGGRRALEALSSQGGAGARLLLQRMGGA